MSEATETTQIQTVIGADGQEHTFIPPVICTALCGGKKGPCTKLADNEGLCKSHYQSFTRRGRKDFDLHQLTIEHRLQRLETTRYEGSPNVGYRVLLYRQQLERNVLLKEQQTYPNSKEDDEADKRKVRKYIVKEIKDQANEIIRTIDVNMYNIREGNLRVARGNSRHIHESMQQYFDKCYLQDVIRDPRVQQSYDNMTNAIMEKEDELTNEAIQQEQREIEEIERGELEEFVNDGQNVHRKEVVDMVVETYRKILDNITVPDEYKWNHGCFPKTVLEVGLACGISKQAGLLMFNKYFEAAIIYNIEAAYPTMLDAVWQFIKNHEDKECLIAILKGHLVDNVGTCSEGNLTRLIYTLSGHMQGIEVRSLKEQLQDLIAPLANEPDMDKRIEKAKRILRSLHLPEREWNEWLDALKEC